MFLKTANFGQSTITFGREMKKNLLIEAHYFPNIEYFINILDHEIVYIEAWESYQKQTLRNRCTILTANKIDVLSVPVINSGRNVLIRDIKIDYTQKWVNVHWRSLCSAYGKAPFFEYYADFFHDIFKKKHAYLFDLNLEIMTVCLKLLRIDKKIEFTTLFDKDPEVEIEDLRSSLHPKKQNHSYILTFATYPQIFGKSFVENLSIIDLLFCEGNNSIEVLRNCNKRRI